MTTNRARRTGFLLFFVATSMFGATIEVNTTADTDAVDGACSLREAVFAAESDAAHNECPAGSGPDRIVFNLPSSSTIVLTAALPTVTETVLFRGPEGGDLSIDGDFSYRHFEFDSPGNNQWFAIGDMTLKHGSSNFGGSVYRSTGDTLEATRVSFVGNQSGNAGGAVLISGDGVATFDTCTFDGNFIVGPSGGGGLQVLDGAFVHVVGSTFVGNSSLGTGSGGAVFVNRGELLLERSTVSGNSSAREGGGIHAGATLPTSTATVTVIDSTIVGNTADSDGDGIGDGGGLSVTIAIGPVTLALHNSIIAGNTTGTGAAASADISLHPSVVIGGGKFTLIGINDSAASHYPAGDPNAAGNFVGTSAAPIDALLQPLANYGGPTLTHRPLNDPATRVIDHGKARRVHTRSCGRRAGRSRARRRSPGAGRGCRGGSPRGLLGRLRVW